MNTILTDDERPKLPVSQYSLCFHDEGGAQSLDAEAYTKQDMEAYADAREAAVLAKLAQQADRQRVPHWQPIDTAPMATELIVWSDFEGVCTGMLDSYGDWYSPNSEYKLTRVCMWMPLPAAPEAPAQCDTPTPPIR